MGFLEKLQARYELFKLEQRYTKRKRRTTFVSEAYYADGEYHYGPPPVPNSPRSPVSSTSTGGSWGHSASVSGGGRNNRHSVIGVFGKK